MVHTRGFRLVLPLPPGVNNQYADAGGRRVLSREHSAFKRTVRSQLHRLRADGTLSEAFVEALKDGYIGVFLDFYFETPFKRDLDGGLKITLDAILAPLGVNDNRVVDIHLVKRVSPLHPRLEVELEAIPDWRFDEEYVYLGS